MNRRKHWSIFIYAIYMAFQISYARGQEILGDGSAFLKSFSAIKTLSYNGTIDRMVDEQYKNHPQMPHGDARITVACMLEGDKYFGSMHSEKLDGRLIVTWKCAWNGKEFQIWERQPAYKHKAGILELYNAVPKDFMAPARLMGIDPFFQPYNFLPRPAPDPSGVPFMRNLKDLQGSHLTSITDYLGTIDSHEVSWNGYRCVLLKNTVIRKSDRLSYKIYLSKEHGYMPVRWECVNLDASKNHSNWQVEEIASVSIDAGTGQTSSTLHYPAKSILKTPATTYKYTIQDLVINKELPSDAFTIDKSKVHFIRDRVRGLGINTSTGKIVPLQ